MIMRHKFIKITIATLALTVISGCTSKQNNGGEISITPTVTVQSTETPTPAPTETPTPAPTETPTPTLTVAPKPTFTPIPDRYYKTGEVPDFPCDAYVDCYSVSLRSTKNAREKVMTLYNGAHVTITGSNGKSFYNCIYNNEEYLISKQYVNFNNPFEYDYGFFEIVDVDDLEYSYKDMESDIFELAEKYPDRFSYYSAGKTADKRELYICTVGNPDAPKCIYYTGTAHAREYCTTHLLMMQAEYYLHYYDEGFFKDVNYRDLLNEICIVMMPMQNPDGAEITISGIGGINSMLLRSRIQEMYDREEEEYQEKYGRHNSNYYRRWKANAEGIDLNRNYGFGWEETNDYPVPSSGGYKGTEPFCAREVQAQISVLNKLKEEKDLVFVISYHATGNDLSWDVPGLDGEFREEIERAVDTLVYYTDYERNMNDMTLAKAPTLAGYTDWLNGERIVPSITIEIFSGDVWLAVDKPEMYDAWIANREVWAILNELYYEGERRQ